MKRTSAFQNGLIWSGAAVGFAACRLLMNADLVIGCTLANILLTVSLCLLTERLSAERQKSA